MSEEKEVRLLTPKHRDVDEYIEALMNGNNALVARVEKLEEQVLKLEQEKT